MNQAKLQHYVPRFYLGRFVDTDGFLWAFDKSTDRVFRTSPGKIAGQNRFYDVPELRTIGMDPQFLEKQFADVESQVSKITECWLRQVQKRKVVEIPAVNRQLVSLFLALQLLRTAEARVQIVQFTKAVQRDTQTYDPEQDAHNLHARVLWNEGLVNRMAEKLAECVWIFARNDTDTPFYTSDHPVLVKSFDNKRWILGPRVFDRGMYVVFPLSPTWIMYCKDPRYWGKLARFDQSVSPVTFTAHMAGHENSGQIGMSHRFVFAHTPDFEFVRMFCRLHPEIKDPERARFEWSPDD
jgi:hypothetical protein